MASSGEVIVSVKDMDEVKALVERLNAECAKWQERAHKAEAKAREFDTAFAALESALRDLLNGMGVCNVDRRWCVNHSMKAAGDATQCEEVADGYAALALAEGVRSE